MNWNSKKMLKYLESKDLVVTSVGGKSEDREYGTFLSYEDKEFIKVLINQTMLLIKQIIVTESSVEFCYCYNQPCVEAYYENIDNIEVIG